MSSPTATATATTAAGLAAATAANPGGVALNKVALFRGAVQGLRRCLEISEATPTHRDSLCNGFLVIVEGPDPEGSLEEFRQRAKPLADGDIYMTAILYALDHARCEEDADFLVLQSVNEQLMRRANARLNRANVR